MSWTSVLRVTARFLRRDPLLQSSLPCLDLTTGLMRQGTTGSLLAAALPTGASSRGFAAEAAVTEASGVSPAPQPQRPLYPVPPQYGPAGRVDEGRYHVERRPVFAVVEVGGTQFKVSPDDLIYSEKLAGVAVNDKVDLNRVLVLGSPTETIIGRPFVPGASVTAAVEEQVLDAKVIIFKKRRRKSSRRTKGHRQPLTALRIVDIVGL